MNRPSERDETSFVLKLLDAVPNGALGAIGTLLALALVMKIIGIDLAGPINEITEAYTIAITQQAEGMESINAATGRMEAVATQLNKSIDDTQVALGRLEAALSQQTQVIRDHETRIAVLENLARMNDFRYGE